MKTASETGYELPLLSKTCEAPLARLRVTVNDEMPVATSMLVLIGKKTN
jgi:hypothetical protein